MPKFLVKARYGAEGIQALLSDGGSSRKKVVEALTKGVGGSLESFYFVFGEDDLYAICDVPDNKAAATLSMVASSSGRVSVTVVPLLTAEEIDAIANSDKPAYSPPGR